MAQECYMTFIKKKEVETIKLDELDMRDELETKPMPSEELESSQLNEEPEHLVYLGSKLVKEVKDTLIQFLKRNAKVFS